MDILGVLLAIRWPDAFPAFDQNIRTNVNVFRHIFAYLSEREELLATQVADDGYLIRLEDEERILKKVVRNGTILGQMEKLGPVKNMF